MIRIALCDDDKEFLQKFSEIISKEFTTYTDDFEIKSYTDGVTLINEHRCKAFDIIFLDIDMPEISGFDVAKKIREDFSNCFIIFITSHSELVYESMDFQPFNFIRKNCNISLKEKISEIVSKLMRHIKQSTKIILEDDISGRCVVYFREIAYIESNKHYIYYHIVNKENPIKIRGSINECEEKYSSFDFVRIHKKYLANLRLISDINNRNDEILIDSIKTKLPMSKNYKKNIKEKYLNYLRSTV